MKTLLILTLSAAFLSVSGLAAADIQNGPNPYNPGYGFDAPHAASWGGWARGDAGTLYAEWDTFIDASYGTATDRTAAPDVGEANVSDAFAAWSAGTFVAGSGNLYSFSVPQNYNFSVTGNVGMGQVRAVLQFEASGIQMNYDSIKLNNLAPTFTEKTFYDDAFPSSMGPTDLVHYLAIWDLPAEPVTYNFSFNSPPHQSLTQVAIDIAAASLFDHDLEPGPTPDPDTTPDSPAWTRLDLAVVDMLNDVPSLLAQIGEKAYLLPENANRSFAVTDTGILSSLKEYVSTITDGKLYILGMETTRVYELNEDHLVEQSELDAMPTSRFEATALTTDRGEIFVFGGKQTRPNGTSRLINRLESFNPETNEWKRHRNIPGINRREGAALAAVSIDGKAHAYLLGGGVLQRNRLFGAIAAYDFELNRWETRAMTPMPTPRAFQSGIQAPVLDGKIYLIGGRSVNSAGGLAKSDKVEIYDPVSNTWQIGPNLPKEIAEPVSFATDGKIYVIDAAQQTEQSAITAWELDGTWKPWLEEDQTCDLDGDGRFTNRDVNLFARACRAGTAYWNCDLTEDGAPIARNIREYRRQWSDYWNQACP
ncbi:Kelch repeat-containing protein [Methylotuvimicrobium buryatense]|uniref:N-acetylneuraminate epimerase n=1 Tax=Methylotuvimicrobium buryatense TaxID=95641 RepID=A0A4P9USE5_METBY|nr:kelch repeat-containing protein [Methylotuvimicrobium buryatense]QCW84357.1 hypothetical protein EQU24_20560 [Methylotuvimicrobium buryatense]